MYVSNKEKLFNAISTIDLQWLNNIIGNDEFWGVIPDLLECGYDQQFYDIWDNEGCKKALLSLVDGLDEYQIKLLANIGQYIDEVGY